MFVVKDDGNEMVFDLYINLLQSGFAYLYLLKTSENLKVFWCFQGA